ncbi:hypothetical protein MMC34_004702 [Xylographa carneopallida]|nr:hypothetical protein [Xylographa carneopallida]
MQVTREEDLPTSSSYLLRISTTLADAGRRIYRHSLAPTGPSECSDNPWSLTSSTATLVDAPIPEPPPRVTTVLRRHPRNLMKPADPYAQFRWGYGCHFFGPASSTDIPVIVPATGSDVFRPPKLSFPSNDPTTKSESSSRRQRQVLGILDKADESDDKLLDAEEFFDTGDTGDTEIVDAGPRIETYLALTADQEELLADATCDDRDVEIKRAEFNEFLARFDTEHRQKE